MQYIIPGTKGLTVRCGDRLFELAEDITYGASYEAKEPPCIHALTAQVVPLPRADTDWTYEASWSIVPLADVTRCLPNCQTLSGLTA